MFRTEINPQISGEKISLSTPLMTIGSCFSDHIGERLVQNKFDTLSNPFGVIFNPISIHKLLNIAAKNHPIDPENWLQSQEIYLHYDVHSQLGNVNQQDAKDNINYAINTAYHQLQKAKWLIITWGTAIVYERKDTGEVVANCHKVPNNQFIKRILSSNEIVTSFETMLSNLPPNLNILLTVSPVRHLKETLELNSVSKSTLRIACHQLANKHNRVKYFPAYELILDDLRDYRFYKSDMLHPDEDAIDYVWYKFLQTYFDKSTLDFIQKWKKITAAINHKPFNEHSDVHQRFIKSTIKTITELNTVVDVTTEINYLEQQLIKQ